MPPIKPARALRIETTWIRNYARTYFPTEAGFSFCDDDLRRWGITLIELRHVFSHGYVTSSEKLNKPGAIWIVEGPDNEGAWYCVTIKVISQQMDVTLIDANRQVEIQETTRTNKTTGTSTE